MDSGSKETKVIKPRLHIVTNNHFDPTWRRCWDRRFKWQGKTYASYSDIEQWYMEENLALAEANPEYRFEAESVVVLRQFLRRCPQRRAEIAALVQGRRFTVAGAGDNIVDGVMPLGESLARNFTFGLDWLEREFGIRPVLAVRSDAFGNPAQLPQILRGCGLRWLRGCSYSPVNGRYWRGMDGSTVCVAELATVGSGGTWYKQPPCPACKGTGCAACRGRGVDPSKGMGPLPGALNDETLARNGVGVVRIAPEEDLPNPGIIAWAKGLAERYDVRFALDEDAYEHLKPLIDKVDAPPPGELHPDVELGFNNSGCWVTRIDLKLALRRNEYAVREAETLAALGAAQGQVWPVAAHEAIWEKLLFTMFHDAVTATHVDAAYEELLDMNAGIAAEAESLATAAVSGRRRDAAGTMSVFNPLGRNASAMVEVDLPVGTPSLTVEDDRGQQLPVVPAEAGKIRVLARDVPALGTTTWRVTPAAVPVAKALDEPVIRNERFEIRADQNGIVNIHDRRLGYDISRRTDCSPGEFVLQSDIGSPWATLEPQGAPLALGRWTKLVASEAGTGWQRLRFTMDGHFSGFKGLHGGMRSVVIDAEVLLVDGLDRVEFLTTVEWDNYNIRLLMAFPVATHGSAWYGVPYGMLPRDPYPPSYGWASPNGDHPAVEWAGVQGRNLSVAVLDAGTPSYGIHGNMIHVSLIRSATVPTYLHEPVSYSMTGFDGMRDTGRHVFRHAMVAYDRPFAQSAVVHDAESFNHVFRARPGRIEPWPAPKVEGDGVRLGAVTWTDDRLLLRLVECRGVAGEAVVRLPAGLSTAERSDLRGQNRTPLAVEDGVVSVPLRAWEIATVVFG